MSSPLKPLILYGGVMGPNPSKVAMILNELGVPWEERTIPYADIKGPEYLKVNPNGRLPTIEDPNTGIKIWESGAIIEYLIERYDTEHKLSFPQGTAEYYACKQWLYFQVSGQGPYYGQAVWFSRFHAEKLPSAIDRYLNEIKRVTGVLEGELGGHDYLVGDKITYADIAFIPWQSGAKKVTAEKYDTAKEFPNVVAWLERLTNRPDVKKVLDEQAERMKAMGH